MLRKGVTEFYETLNE